MGVPIGRLITTLGRRARGTLAGPPPLAAVAPPSADHKREERGERVPREKRGEREHNERGKRGEKKKGDVTYR